MKITKAGFTIALIFDLTQEFNVTESMPFPTDATAEWESLETIAFISKTWTDLGYEVIEMPLDKNFLTQWTSSHARLSLVHSLVEGWGSSAREGWIASLCELSGVPYLGSGPTATNIAMRKSYTKILCSAVGVRTPKWFLISHLDDLTKIDKSFLTSPHFIKPDGEGSGMGIDASFSCSRSLQQTYKVCERLLTLYPDGVLLEEHIDGPEYTSALIGTPLIQLPIARIEVDNDVYGLAHKSKTHMGERVTFPTLAETAKKEIEEGGKKLCQLLGFLDFVRFDWKSKRDGTIYFLEANPLAGLSYFYSVLPKMAHEGGYSYASFLKILADGALLRRNAKKYWYGKTCLSESTFSDGTISKSVE